MVSRDIDHVMLLH